MPDVERHKFETAVRRWLTDNRMEEIRTRRVMGSAALGFDAKVFVWVSPRGAESFWDVEPDEWIEVVW